MVRHQLGILGFPITIDLGDDQHRILVYMQLPHFMLECNLQSQNAGFILCLVIGAGEGHLPCKWDQLSLWRCQDSANASSSPVDCAIEV